MTTGTEPAVSVIIPAYNAAGHIRTALDSVFAQTCRDYEVIVVNDGSADTPALEDVLATYRTRLRYLAQAHAGVSAARNAGIRAARAPLVAMLDSDDAWEPEYLEAQLGFLDAHPGLDVVYPNARIVGDHPLAGRLYSDVCPSIGPVTFEALVTQRCHVFTGVLARRETLVRAGLYNEGLRASEDFELWVRVVAAGGRIGYHPRPLVRFTKRRGSLSSDPVWMAEQAVTAYDTLAAGLTLTPDQRRILDRRREFFRAAAALNRGKRAFFRLEPREARTHLREANRHFRSWKIAIACTLLPVMPQTLLALYRLRDRFLLRASYDRWPPR